MENSRAQELIKSLHNTDILSEEDSAYIVYDLDLVQTRYSELKDAFPADTLHGIAVKACPLPYFLKLQADRGLGAEAASIEEVQIALASGVPAERVIFDGPAKTRAEIQFCIDKSIYINIDSFEELERVNSLVGANTHFKAGLRINPQIGNGKIGDTSVAGKRSKFGVNLDDYMDRINKAFEDYSWLVGVHVHIGSQGMSVDDLVNGTSKVFEKTKNLTGLERFDLGGGLPVVNREDDLKVGFKTYTDALAKAMPELFSGKFKLLTEFGRRIYSDTAIAISNIEYVKEGHQIVAHLGADMFLRRAYKPNDWYHQMSVLTCNGEQVTNDSQTYSVAGPLCFGGDFLSREVSLPKVEEGDLLLIHDVGAYTLSMWSRHCSRFTPKVVGISGDNTYLLKKRESLEQLIQFWS
ncbi:MAG: hypothetical protein KC478_05780 [Bacteriovoracaceae bacterium]|nr:hypothetical protein [Bacteriovoracaceae bacterium]